MNNYTLFSLVAWLLCGGFTFHYFYHDSGAADSLVENGTIASKLGVLVFCLLGGAGILIYQIISALNFHYSPGRYKKLYLHNFKDRDEMTVKVMDYYAWVSKAFKQAKSTSIDAEILSEHFEYFKHKEGENPLAVKMKITDYYLYLKEFEPELFNIADHKNYLN